MAGINMTPFFSILLPFLTIIFISSGLLEVEGGHLTKSHTSVLRPKKLFVFGDSYADTGNTPISQSRAWKVPYGITFPGKPTGRFSDGRVATDFLANSLGLKTPVAYRWRKLAPATTKKYGINFATGGTGVFDTVLIPGPNMTTQIDLFQQLIKQGYTITKKDLSSSLVFVALSGNDYSSYLAKNGSIQGLPAFIVQVVNQLAVNLKRIQALGVRKVAVSALEPVGCLPHSTFTAGFQQCNTTSNQLSALHNTLLQQAVNKLNNETEPSTFVVIDFFTAFISVIQSQGNSTFPTPLVPCCVGVNASYVCGSVDAQTGEPKYRVCPNPSSALFWDLDHPTQAGWRAVFSTLKLPF